MKRRLTIIVAVAMTALVTTLANMAMAPPPPPVTGTGTDLTRVKVIGTTSSASTSSTSFVPVPDASRTINVAADETALIVTRFAADSRCASGPSGAGCLVRILIGGVEADPATGFGSAFDQVPTCTPSSGTCTANDLTEAHAIERWRTVGPGTYTVEVEFRAAGSGTVFDLTSWTLEVDRFVV